MTIRDIPNVSTIWTKCNSPAAFFQQHTVNIKINRQIEVNTRLTEIES